jgi:hypothetical protein
MIMSESKIKAGTWHRDLEAYDPNARKRVFTLNGCAFVARSTMGGQADDWPLTIRELVTGRYVATVSNWRRMPEQLAERLATQD